MNTSTNIQTKVNKDATAVTTALTINWDGVSQEDMQKMAQQALIVKLQGNLRRDENGIPTELTVNASDYKVGTRVAKAKVDPLAAIMALPSDERAAFIAKLQESLKG